MSTDKLRPPVSTGTPEVRGTHWLELVNKSGAIQQIRDNAFLRADCPSCCFFFLTSSNPGPLACPLCGHNMEYSWQRVQVRFVLEAENDPISEG
jgi:hypothetical protein